MKTKHDCFRTGLLIALTLVLNHIAQAAGEMAHAPGAPARPAGQTNAPIPWDQIGTKAGADYHGDGLAVTPAADGARLHCVFQRLEGEATRAGLWLVSAVTNTVADRFQVKAASIGRTEEKVAADLSTAGEVVVNGQNVSFVRPGLTEEYSVSLDGLRQDFVVTEKPAGAGELRVRLDVSGAQVKAAADGAQLVLAKSGRKIAYNRLRVTDVTGKELTARMEAGMELAVVVNDAGAVYPVRIDPTFSDANWISLGAVPSANGPVYAEVLDGSGNLFIGGQFTMAGGVGATNVAKWNGSSWSSLGSGISGSGDGYGPSVFALATSGTNLYVGGDFSTAGNTNANFVAQWNGSVWKALSSGVNGELNALAVSGTNLYVGGYFKTAGGVGATNIAKWNGSSWSALGSGTDNVVRALAVSGTNLYAGGWFTTAGGVAANNIAQWNGSWLALGSGILGGGAHGHGPTVFALAVAGTNLYVGGDFSTAGGFAANDIARWNGSSWSALGSGLNNGVNNDVFVLAVDVSSNLYVGGEFTKAGGGVATEIARWNGSSWSAMGSGMDSGKAVTNDVYALAVDVSGNLYAGGDFTAAGTNASPYVAEALFALPAAPFVIATTNGGFGFTNRQFRFTLTGPAGSNAVISASTNLQNWLPLATNPLVGGSLTFTDGLATNYPSRYYRATLQP